MKRHLDLMRLHDGDLDADEAAELTASLDAEDQAILDGLTDLGETLRLAESHSDIDLTGDIMARLDEEPLAEVKQLPSMPMRRYLAGGLVLAAAAAVALWMSSSGKSEPTTPVARRAPVVQQARTQDLGVPVVEPTPAPDEESEGPAAAAIEAVDFGNRAGSIFMVPAGEETTPVVWLEDESAEGHARVEPL